eukprot:scaffold50433_cov38-Tisochrysis_lutea.AAC.4
MTSRIPELYSESCSFGSAPDVGAAGHIGRLDRRWRGTPLGTERDVLAVHILEARRGSDEHGSTGEVCRVGSHCIRAACAPCGGGGGASQQQRLVTNLFFEVHLCRMSAPYSRAGVIVVIAAQS